MVVTGGCQCCAGFTAAALVAGCGARSGLPWWDTAEEGGAPPGDARYAALPGDAGEAEPQGDADGAAPPGEVPSPVDAGGGTDVRLPAGCTAADDALYLLSDQEELFRFDPNTLIATLVGPVRCGADLNSMTIARTGD